MSAEGKIYFASDFHLGVPTPELSAAREKKIVAWLNFIEKDADEIFLCGDLFDFWFEHKYTAPKGHVRFLGKLAELTDKGIKITFFTGNHDMWMFGYLKKELGVEIYRHPVKRTFNGKSFVVGHGDGLGPGDKGYKLIKGIFANPVCQWLYARFHPNFSFWLANYFSKTSRISTGSNDEVFLGEEKEWLVQYCKQQLQKEHIDYFVFGHRHLPLDIHLPGHSRYVNLGEWINHCTYAVFDGQNLKLEKWHKS